MKAAKIISIWIMLSSCILIAPDAHAEEVTYTLEDLILDDNSAQMFGTFTWTYEVGDFENGVGEFSFLDIPFTVHDHTDLDATFDVDNSIEITLEGSVHDDGVDITLFLLQPLTPTTSSAIDLVESKYEIGGNGFHDGAFLSGEIVPSLATSAGDEPAAAALPTMLTVYPNPFNPVTTLKSVIPRSGHVRLSIHDLNGRRIVTLLDGVFMDAGEVVHEWNGRDSKGVGVHSGIYFARLEIDDLIATRKLILLK